MRNRRYFYSVLVTSSLLALAAANTAFGQVTPVTSPSPIISTGISTPVLVTGFTNVPSFTLVSSTSESPQIFAGIVGPVSNTANPALCDTSSTGGLCNNCTYTPGGPFVACNQKRIYGALTFSVTFTVVQQVTAGQYWAFLGYTNSGTTQVFNNYASQGYPITAQGQSITLTGTWGEICTGSGLSGTNGGTTDACADASGTDSFTNTLTVTLANAPTSPYSTSTGIANYNTTISVTIMNESSGNADGINIFDPTNPADNVDVGISQFMATPGDQEIELTNVLIGDCPANPQAFRVFYWPDDGTQASQVAAFGNASYMPSSPASATAPGATAQYQDMPVDTSCNQQGDWTIQGLTNDQGYFFNISLVDQGGNNYFLLNPPAITGGTLVGGTTCNNTMNWGQSGASGDATNDAGCWYYATPSKVEGLLPNELNCFIATAAYGSAFEPAVKTFRAFRNKYLLTSALGQKLVRSYYHFSPHYAQIIKKNEFLRSVARLSLTPLWGFAWLSLYYTPIGVLLMLITVITFAIITTRRFKRGEW